MTEPPSEYVEVHAPTRWWLPWMPASQVRRQLRGLWSYAVAQTEATSVALEQLRREMANAEDQAYARAAEVVALIKAEFASLKGQVDAAIADKDAAVQAGVEHALAEDSAADAARVEGLIDKLASVLPAPVPEVEVPAPGEPAELPEHDDDGPETA